MGGGVEATVDFEGPTGGGGGFERVGGEGFEEASLLEDLDDIAAEGSTVLEGAGGCGEMKTKGRGRRRKEKLGGVGEEKRPGSSRNGGHFCFVVLGICHLRVGLD